VPSEAVDQCPSCNVPDAHDLILRTGGDKAIIGRDGHARHARVGVGSVDRKHLRFARAHVPYPRCVARQARDDERTIVRKVEGPDTLLVASDRVTDAFTGDIPYL